MISEGKTGIQCPSYQQMMALQSACHKPLSKIQSLTFHAPALEPPCAFLGAWHAAVSPFA